MNNIISNKISMFRNLKNYKFLNKLTSKEKEEIVDKLLEVYKDQFKLVNCKDFASNSNVLLRLVSNCKNTVLVDEKQSAIINLFDKEEVEIVAENEDIDFAYNVVKLIENKLANKIELAYNDDYGYLMSDLLLIGSGLKLETTLALTALCEMEKIDQLKQNLNKLGYNLKKTNLPAVYILSNMCNLGFSERQVIEDFKKMVTKLDSLEVESAKMLDLTKHDEIIDKVRRSEGILGSAYLLTSIELVEHLNNLRLGVDLGVSNLSIEKINKLQDLTTNLGEFNTDDESKKLAQKVNLMIKGE